MQPLLRKEVEWDSAKNKASDLFENTIEILVTYG